MNAFITPHSHYDYLWCDTPDGMGAKNSKLIKEALLLMRKFPTYKYIVDSAMAIEYFKLHHPELMPELVQRVKERRVELMGGMVVAPDTLLASGESLARQLLHGVRYFLHHFDTEPETGFLIDSFGLTPQLPQLLVKAGLKQLVFVRGAVDRKMPQEFNWKALDGTSILTHWMRFGYAWVPPPYTGTILAPLYPFAPIPFTIALIPQAFKIHEIIKKVFPPFKIILQRIACLGKGASLLGSDIGGLPFTIKNRAHQATTKNVFVLCGMDNLPPSSNVVDAVDYLNRKNTHYRARIMLPRDFFAAVRDSHGRLNNVGPCEMSGFTDKFTGTYSTRILVKQGVRACEHGLFQAEVASSVAFLRANFPYPSEDIERATWRLLRCCFHDALPGCHVDAANEHIMAQLKLSRLQLDRTCKSALTALASSISTGLPNDSNEFILVFNALAAERAGITRIVVSEANRLASVLDESGRPARIQKDSFSPDPDALVMACTNVAAAGYSVYNIIRGAGFDKGLRRVVEPVESRTSTRGETVEVKGRDLSLVFEAGRLVKIKNRAGVVLAAAKSLSINEIRIFNDRGDSYLAGKMPEQVFTTHGNKIDIIEDGPVRVVVRISSRLQCRDKRFAKPINDVVQYVILNDIGTPRVDFITRIENRTRNVRIQACFPVPVENPVFRTEVAFGDIERNPAPQRGNSWGEKNKDFAHYDRSFPAINWMDVSSADGDNGMAILNDGLPEHEIDENKEMVYLTLLRSTGCIGTLFPGNVPTLLGPFYSIPGAYELCKHECRYSLIFHGGNHVTGRIATEALGFNVPLISITARGIPDRINQEAKHLLSVQPTSFLVTAIKRSEADREEIVIRVLETSGRETEGTITFGQLVGSARLLDLVERPLAPVGVWGGSSINFSCKAYEVVTFGIKFG